ncbi:hypothetical protein N9I21_04070 [Crocinitomicaceae bacterium]|jgi:hypothetical protein|nr:hypothetical protein [Crocinitomicaceae bacterium]
MRYLFILLLSCSVTFSLKSQYNGFIGSADFNVLYVGYDNKIGGIVDNDECISELSATNAKVTFLKDNIYSINPLVPGLVEITLSCLDQVVEVRKFNARYLPLPKLRNYRVSHSGNVRLWCVMAADFHLGGINFAIVNGSIDGKSFEGDIISKDITGTFSVGQEVDVELKVKNLTDGRIVTVKDKVLIVD